MAFHIYHLIDPTDGVVRYVGRCTDPKARFRNHCHEAKRRSTTRKHAWINGLLEQHKAPVLIVVCVTTCPWLSRQQESAEFMRHQDTVFNTHDPLRFPAIIAKKRKR